MEKAAKFDTLRSHVVELKDEAKAEWKRERSSCVFDHASIKARWKTLDHILALIDSLNPDSGSPDPANGES